MILLISRYSIHIDCGLLGGSSSGTGGSEHVELLIGDWVSRSTGGMSGLVMCASVGVLVQLCVVISFADGYEDMD